ncbi:tetratricopeptide repeat protein [Corticibacter populi]|nr:tetratricopeptide repeat protein [Corticibacter populi]
MFASHACLGRCPTWRQCAVAAAMAWGFTALAAGSDMTATSQQAWQQRYDSAQAAYAADELDAAEQAARQALVQARAGQGQTQPFIASSLNVLALVRQRQGHADEAQQLLREALQISEQTLGPHANTALLAFNLGQVQEERGGERRHLALQSYRRALQIAEALPGDAAAAQLRQQALAALSRVHESLGEKEQARSYNQRLREGEAAIPDQLKALALLRHGRELQQQGQWQQAQVALEQSLQLHEREYGKDAVELVPVLTALGNLHHARGKHEQAVPLHQWAVRILRAREPDSRALAGHLSELGLWHGQRGELEQARAFFEQALALVRRQQEGHPSLAEADLVSSLAQLEGTQGRMEEAKLLHQQALAQYRRLEETPAALLGQARSLNYLAGFEHRRRRFAEAEPQFLQALALMERALGAEDAQLLPVLQNLEALYLSQGRVAQARPYQLRVQALESAQGQKHDEQSALAGPRPDDGP